MSRILFPLIVNGAVFAVWLVLFFKDKKKGVKAIAVGSKTIFSMLPMILIIIGLIGIFSSFLNPVDIAKYFGEETGTAGFFLVSLASSFLQIPGIIAFPIASTLFKSGMAISIVAVFACASTMASVFTLPLEMRILGKKFAFIRIGLTYILCVAVGALTGLLFKLFG